MCQYYDVPRPAKEAVAGGVWKQNKDFGYDLYTADVEIDPETGLTSPAKPNSGYATLYGTGIIATLTKSTEYADDGITVMNPDEVGMYEFNDLSTVSVVHSTANGKEKYDYYLAAYRVTLPDTNTVAFEDVNGEIRYDQWLLTRYDAEEPVKNEVVNDVLTHKAQYSPTV